MTEGCDPKPMADWIQEPDLKTCRPCILGPVVQWYRDELKAQGQDEHATSLEKLAETTNTDEPSSVLTFCQELDKIKAAVEEPLRERLKDFDCAVQSYDQQAAVAEEPEQQQTEK